MTLGGLDHRIGKDTFLWWLPLGSSWQEKFLLEQVRSSNPLIQNTERSIASELNQCILEFPPWLNHKWQVFGRKLHDLDTLHYSVQPQTFWIDIFLTSSALMQSNLEKKAEYLAMQLRSIFQCETERRKNILENGWKKRKKRVFLESLSDASRGREGTPKVPSCMHRTISQLIETENEERERKKNVWRNLFLLLPLFLWPSDFQFWHGRHFFSLGRKERMRPFLPPFYHDRLFFLTVVVFTFLLLSSSYFVVKSTPIHLGERGGNGRDDSQIKKIN